ncbi:MAG: NUDIX domain-containing protein [Candidatus Moranbacteria bacterium]|nr:NUDIX domain-containing protein [Candidatus Moranbacteria bacterium]OIQ02011.1 MAG: hypothetical protein AUK58_03870 [Candidatus Moranbacteria bacterium CG2_30_41_165]PIP25949.1 MAG: diadenosine tetraphosphate hydrolase [Candidatus Moranbacteria bacterium CG23_combo_of_CG06-09_8_20_14_all_41_28]PIV85894.1 MAG: diadenosine tetraphosphate hydrolase [Candidatus Moranbacteria bacterium CG17_big_fil_post_rev_8_21_14_2_50_41_107]PIW94379.1 MAG: diadenosine tetraphosphate hydrolase [Candidatus Mora
MRLPVIKPLYFLLKIFGFPVIWEVSIGTILYHMKDGKREYLLLHYPSGHYDFVKGHMETGETEEMTLRRETEEETGITDLHLFPLRQSTKFFYIARGSERVKRIKAKRGIWIFKQVHFYPAETKAEDVKISFEHTGFLWLPYEKAVEKITFDNAKNILVQTEKYITSQPTL